MIDKIEFKHIFEDSLKRRSIELPDISGQLIGDYFYALLCKNEQVNLTGYHKVEDFVDFHLIDAIKLVDIVDPPQNCVIFDIGSGAGLPGLLIKMIRPDISITMIETTKKKADFIKQVIDDLNLLDCQVINSRAEDAAHNDLYREKADIAIARALASISAALELTTGFVKKKGLILLPRGAGEDILELSTNPAKTLGCIVKKVDKYSLPGRETDFNAVVYEKIENLSPKYPRKPGQIKKQPL